MEITKKLIELDPTLMTFDESKWSADVKGYRAFNNAGVECEVGEFLFAMTRILKPQYVLETGTHQGIGAAYMGMALKDNGFGQLQTIEFQDDNWKQARIRMEQLGLTDVVTCILTDAADFETKEQYDLIFLDTEPQTRFAELIKFYDNLKGGGYFFIHDLHRHMHQIENEEHGFAWPFGKIPHELHDLVIFEHLRPFHFPTPRGFTGFYKTSPRDHIWYRDYIS